MKMLCIRGRLHRIHTGLFAGRVYEVDIVQHCCDLRAYAMGSVFKCKVILNCRRCMNLTPTPVGAPVPWGPDRFVPWQPDALKSIVHEAKSSLKPRKKSKPRERVT